MLLSRGLDSVVGLLILPLLKHPQIFAVPLCLLPVVSPSPFSLPFHEANSIKPSESGGFTFYIFKEHSFIHRKTHSLAEALMSFNILFETPFPSIYQFH